MDAFYTWDGERYLSGPLTRGPWDDRAQHGGPPAALLGGAMARYGDDADRFFLARVSTELLRPVPLAPLTVQVEPVRLGRAVQRLRATLLADGRPVVTASGTRIRRAEVAVPEAPRHEPWTPPAEDTPRFVFPFFRNDVAYHRAIELVVVHGAWGRTPIGVWGRPVVPLVAGQETLPLERVLILADAQSGMGVPTDPDRFSFVNPDLTVYFERDPVGTWAGFDIRSTANASGSGLAQSAIRDEVGLVGRSAQSLVVAPRAPRSR